MKRLLCVLLAVGVIGAACGGGDSDTFVQSGTEEGLAAYLAELKTAYVEVDFEALHALQSVECDYTVDEVREGFLSAQALLLAFTGSTFSDLVADIEFEITDFDEENLTAVVANVATGESAELFGDGENDPTEFRFVDGTWASDEDCIGAGLDENGVDAATDTLPSDQELLPADEVTAQRDRDASVDLEVGDAFTLPDGVVVTIRSIEIDPEYVPGEPWSSTHLIELRSENPTTEDASNPDVSIYCEGMAEGGSWFGDGTYDPFGELPSGSFADGVLSLSVPQDDDGFPLEPCNDPVVRVSTFGFFDEDEASADYPAPALPTG